MPASTAEAPGTAKPAEHPVSDSPPVGGAAWNDRMYHLSPTPYRGLAGTVEHARLRQIARWARRVAPTRVLDVGCGEGVLFDALGRDAQVLGVDLSGDSLRTSRRLRANSRVVQADGAGGLPFCNHAFDLVVCSEVLEHVPEPARLIAEVWRVCSQDGWVILTVPIERPKLIVKSVLRRMRLLTHLFPGIEPGFSAWHLHNFGQDALRSLLDGRFDVASSRCVWGLHRCLLIKPLATAAALG